MKVNDNTETYATEFTFIITCLMCIQLRLINECQQILKKVKFILHLDIYVITFLTMTPYNREKETL